LIFSFPIWIAIQAQAFCISANEAKLREGPNSKAKVTWTVGKYTPLLTVKRQGSWVQVEDMDGEVHWVSAASGSEKLSCLSIKSPVAKLRTGASAQSPLADLRQVDRYTGFKKIDRVDDWFQAQAPWGTEYWIHESNVWRPLKVQNIGF
jgi:SH3-like domain-containing protein